MCGGGRVIVNNKYNIGVNKKEENGAGKKKLSEVICNQSEFKSKSLNLTGIFENNIECTWASTKDAAAILGITPNALRIRKYRGQIEYRYFGKFLRFNVNYLSTLFRYERQDRKV